MIILKWTLCLVFSLFNITMTRRATLVEFMGSIGLKKQAWQIFTTNAIKKIHQFSSDDP